MNPDSREVTAAGCAGVRPAAWRGHRRCVALLLLAAAAAPLPATADELAAAAGALRSLHASAAPGLQDSPFGQPLTLRSMQDSGTLSGEVLAIVAYPFAQVRAALARPADWCAVLALAPNVLGCNAAGAGLALHVGRRFDQPVAQAHVVDFGYDQRAGGAYFRADLTADEGPLGTHDYRIRLEAIPLAGERSFLRFGYRYSYGLSARLATGAYLATAGSDKVGFTARGRGADGTPRYIDGLRGAVERNAMRYYLAIDAHLATQAAPPEQRFEQRLDHWLAAVERYPRQLAEDDRRAYAAAKRAQQPAR